MSVHDKFVAAAWVQPLSMACSLPGLVRDVFRLRKQDQAEAALVAAKAGGK